MNTSNLSSLELLFNAAAARGFKTPSIRAMGLRFKRAPDSGRNAGSIYVTQNSDYLGKIQNRLFWPVFRVDQRSAVILSDIAEVMDNPQDAVIKYGHRTGQCGICGRRLDNAQSVKLGIGPICAEKMGWSGFTDLIDDSEMEL